MITIEVMPREGIYDVLGRWGQESTNGVQHNNVLSNCVEISYSDSLIYSHEHPEFIGVIFY